MAFGQRAPYCPGGKLDQLCNAAIRSAQAPPRPADFGIACLSEQYT